MSPAKPQLVGSSLLNLPIPVALPVAPDIPGEPNHVPGGVLVPCTPGQNETTRRNQALLNFGAGQGFQLALRRIHLRLPVFLQENTLVESLFETVTNTNYATLKEAEEALTLKGGVPGVANRVQPISLTAPYEYEGDSISRQLEKATNSTETLRTVTLKRSVLPITVQVLAAIIGPEGAVWSESFDVALNYGAGEAGHANGGGLIDSYADLNNPITIDTSKVYGLALFVRIPTTVTTNIQIGVEDLESPVPGVHSEVTFFYDIEAVPVGK